MSAKKGALILHPVQLSSNCWTNAMQGWSGIFLQSGAAIFQNKSASRVLSAGDVLVIREGTGGTLQAKDPSEFAAWCLRFFPHQFNGLLSEHERLALQDGSDASHRVRFYHAGTEIARHFGALAGRVQQKNSTVAHWHTIELVAAILGGEFSDGNGNGETEHAPGSRLAEALARIGFEEFQQLSVEELARKCGYSKRHLSRLFHEQYGRSVVAYKIELRLEKAAAMLAKSEAKIIHVALECGFNHLGLFSAKFKERFGASPGEWRRNLCSEGKSPELARGAKNWRALIGLDRSESPEPAGK